MKVAVSAQGKTVESAVDPRFGRARYFMVFEKGDLENCTVVDNVQNLQSAQGAGIQSAGNVVNAGCAAVITGHCGPKAFAALQRAQVVVYTVSEQGISVRDALREFQKGTLCRADAADVQGHW